VDKLDELLKIYVQKIKENSAAMLERLNADLEKESEDIADTEQSAVHLEAVLADLQEELKATKRQRVRDLMKHPEQEAVLEETYDELESDLVHRMEGVQNQIQMTADKRNTIIQVNRAAKTAMDVFDDILNKEKLDRNDLELIIQKIKVYEDHLEIQLKADIDSILRCGTIQDVEAAVAAISLEGNANFPDGTGNIEPVTIVQRAEKRPDKVFRANVISDGDPLEIYTDKDGGVIFRKYSLMSGLADFAAQLCETLNRTTGHVAVITDRDSCIAVAGLPRREVLERLISPELERLMEGRQIYQYKSGETPLPLCGEDNGLCLGTAAPILSEGDVLGSVVFAGKDGELRDGEVEYKLAQSVSTFLGKHMES
jgi:stage V sporulation protein T